MAPTDWIQALKVADLKEELKKRGQPVTGKKAELAARLEAFEQENEVRPGQAGSRDTAPLCWLDSRTHPLLQRP